MEDDQEKPLTSVGPQNAGDDPFTARMRLHQSWYRAEVLALPHGDRLERRGPRPLGNMLTHQDGRAGNNFLTPRIHATALRRAAAGHGVEADRLERNMLSSQPMCFNLFAPLVDDPIATRLVRALWGPGIGRVRRIEIEWAPQPASEYLGDRTSFDAFIEYERESGGLGFFGIETKLTEPFSPERYDGPGYRRWMTPDAPWRAEAAGKVDARAHNQLWRNHLLAWSMLRHPAKKYAEGRCVVVRHPGDARCGIVLAGYRSLLRDVSTLQELPLDAIVAAWRKELGESDWLDAFSCRYLELQRSEHLVGARP